MSWWGKVVGGTVGFMLGGPLGALLGVSIGDSIDKRNAAGGSSENFLPGHQERTQAAFFTATFSVMGHIAKADGKVSQHEISLANRLMREMRLNEQQKQTAQALFNQGKDSADFDLGFILQQLRQECHRRTTLLQMFLEIQVQAAYADGKLDAAEVSILEYIAAQLGFSKHDLDTMIDKARGAGGSQSKPITDPYKVLGVARDTPLPEIKRAYRRLLNQHHPDKLVSKGLPEEMIKLANQKTHEIRQAWKQIQASG